MPNLSPENHFFNESRNKPEIRLFWNIFCYSKTDVKS